MYYSKSDIYRLMDSPYQQTPVTVNRNGTDKGKVWGTILPLTLQHLFPRHSDGYKIKYRC